MKFMVHADTSLGFIGMESRPPALMSLIKTKKSQPKKLPQIIYMQRYNYLLQCVNLESWKTNLVFSWYFLKNSATAKNSLKKKEGKIARKLT